MKIIGRKRNFTTVAFEKRIAGRLVRRQGDTILNMVTLSHSLDIPKAERSRYFSETEYHLPPLACRATFRGFSAHTYLYRIFKLKEGCTLTGWWEEMTENVATEDKTGLTIFSQNTRKTHREMKK